MFHAQTPSSAEVMACHTATGSGNLWILFDLGGVAGGALAGTLADASGAAVCISAAFLAAAVPALVAYHCTR